MLSIIDANDVLGDGKKRLLIIGNGFDLDLGLKTSYQDFAKSRYWPQNISNSSLGKYIARAKVNHWFDLEEILAKYGETYEGLTKKEVEDNKASFYQLLNGLYRYLSNIEAQIADIWSIKRHSIAADLLRAFCSHTVPQSLYSFNYTSLEKIGKALEIEQDITYKHVHGSIGKHMILGVGESYRFTSNDFLYKLNQRGQESSGISEALAKSDIIVFFGHSLSKNDHFYFKSFFDDVATGKHKYKYIRVFTFNQGSKAAILRSLRTLGTDLGNLQNNSDFQILTTETSVDIDKIREVIDKIKPTPEYLIPKKAHLNPISGKISIGWQPKWLASLSELLLRWRLRRGE